MKEVKFEDIKKANETIVTLDVKGKDYAEVNQRIKAFRMVYPEGFITTKMLSNENGIVVFKAEVGYHLTFWDITSGQFDMRCITLGTGTAYEKEGSTFINKTSYIENCETSAVGRALAMAGFGIDTSIASAEEVQNAIAQQNEKLEDKAPLIQKMHELIIEHELDYEKILRKFKVKKDVDMTIEQLQNAISVLEKMED